VEDQRTLSAVERASTATLNPSSAFAQVHTRCVIVSFLANLSWHDDNKIQMYQAAEEVKWFTNCDSRN